MKLLECGVRLGYAVVVGDIGASDVDRCFVSRGLCDEVRCARRPRVKADDLWLLGKGRGKTTNREW
jgi:hypothetical protein